MIDWNISNYQKRQAVNLVWLIGYIETNKLKKKQMVTFFHRLDVARIFDKVINYSSSY